MTQVLLVLEHKALHTQGLVIGRPQLREAPERLEATLRVDRGDAAQDDLVRSCGEAALLVWRVLRSSDYPGRQELGKPLRLRYTLADAPVAPQGASADLAFTCMLLLDRLNAGQQDDGEPSSMVAATGELFGTAAQVAAGYRNPQLQVRLVGGVPAKVSAALSYFAQHGQVDIGRVLVPQGNVQELKAQPELAQALDRGVIVPVGELQDVLDALRALPRLPERLRSTLAALRSPFSGNPFRGLQAFEIQHRAQYFGRQAQIQQVLDKLPADPQVRQLPGVLIYGYSGSGKSSLLKAGVLGQALYVGAVGRRFLPQNWQPNEQPLALSPVWRGPSLANPTEATWCESLARHWQAVLGEADLRADSFQALGQSLEEALSRRAPSFGAHTHWVLGLDQMEELISQVPDSGRAEADRLLSGLQGLLGRLQRAGVWVLGTVREEYVGRIKPHLAAVFDREVALGVLDEQQQREFISEVIERPCQLAGIALEPQLLDALKGDARDAASVPLLQFALDELYRLAKQRQQTDPGAPLRLTLQDYEQLGGIGQAVNAKARELLKDEPLNAARVLGLLGRMARRAQRGAAHDGGYVRVPVELDEAEQRLLQPWVNERLVVRAGAQAEVAHEALLNHFTELREWLQRHEELLQWRQDHLLPPIRRWLRSGGDAQWLLGERDLTQGTEALALESLLSQAERNYIERSQEALRHRLKRELVRKRLRVSLSLAALIVALTLGAWAWRTAQLRESEALASLARRAADEGLPDRAARFAVAALPPFGSTPLQPWFRPAEVTLSGAALRNRLRLVLSGHESDVYAAFSADGTRIATASKDGTARIWNAITGETIAELKGHAGPVRHADFSPNGQLLVTASDDRTARVWELSSGRTLRVLEGHIGKLGTARFSPDGTRIVTASDDENADGKGGWDGTARLWETQTGRLIAGLQHRQRVNSAVFSGDGTRIVTASHDRTAQQWDGRTGSPIGEPMQHGSYVNSAVFSADGGRIVTASWQGGATVFDASTGQRLGAAVERGRGLVWHAALSPDGLRLITATSPPDNRGRLWRWSPSESKWVLIAELPHGHHVWGGTFSPDGALILTASFDGTAKLWDAHGGELIAVLRGHRGNVRSAVFSADGKRILTASDDHWARVWDVAAPLKVSVLRGHDSTVSQVAFSPDGSRLVTGSDGNGKVLVWNAQTGAAMAELAGHSQTINSVDFAAGGDSIVTASNDRTVRVWDGRTGPPLAVLEGHTDGVRCAVFDARGSRIASGSNDKTVRLWKLDSGSWRGVVLGMHASYVQSVAFSSDGSRLVSTALDTRPAVWDMQSEKKLFELVGHRAAVLRATYSRDGRQILTASEDGTVKLWGATDGALVATLFGHTGAVHDARFSADGSLALTASIDGNARIWDGRNGAPVSVLTGHTAWVRTAAFDAGGSRVVTASEDGTARLWDVASATPIAILTGHSGPIRQALFSPDGKRVATISVDKTGRLWDVSALADLHGERLRDEVCGRQLLNAAAQSFTDEEMEYANIRGREDLRNPCTRTGGLTWSYHRAWLGRLWTWLGTLR